MFKKIFSLTILLSSTTAFSAKDISEVPHYICDEVACSSSQVKILDQFLKSTSIVLEKSAVYSGNCFHLDYNNDGNFKHHGVAYLVPSENENYWGGSFAFFNESNPYKTMNVETARMQFGEVEKDIYNQLQKKEDYLFKNYGDEEKFLRYWMRLSKDKKHLYILSLWGIDHRMMCDLTKNK